MKTITKYIVLYFNHLSGIYEPLLMEPKKTQKAAENFKADFLRFRKAKLKIAPVNITIKYQ